MRPFVFILINLAVAAGTRAQSPEVQRLAELRERGAFQEAETQGAELWQRAELSDRDRAELAIELALTYTQHALAAPQAAREPLWTSAEQVCAAIADRWPDNPRRQLVDVQAALVSLARGQQCREVAAGSAEGLAEARQHLQSSARRFQEIADAVDQQLIEWRLRPPDDPAPDALSTAELESLARHLSLHSARALRQLAQCFAPRTPDYDDALLQAAARLEPLAQQATADELVWQARVELAAVLRELGHLQPAHERLAAWSRDNPPPQIAARLAGETHQLRQPAAQPTSPTRGPQALARTAAEHYHAGRLDEAVAAYDRAAELFTERRQGVDAFVAAMSAAAIERTAGRHEQAAARYQRAALGQPAHSRAAEAHRLAILSAADVLRAAAEEDLPSLAVAYEELLTEHLARWPTSPTAEEVRWWLGQLYAGRHDWPVATELLEQLPPASAHFANAVRLIVDGYEQRLASVKLSDEASQPPAGPTRAELLAAATRSLQPVVTGPDNRWPTEWTSLQRDVALSLARMHVRHSDGESSYAERLLTAALRGAAAKPHDDETRAWESSAQALLALARVRNEQPLDAGQLDVAVAEFAKLAEQHPDDGDVQVDYALLLSQSESQGALRDALAQWQRVEQRSRDGSSRWRRARQARIDLLARLGNHEEAEKLANLTRLLYPGWDKAAADAP